MTAENWKLMPDEPTSDMIAAGFIFVNRRLAELGDAAEMINLWRAMVAASPPAPAAEVESVAEGPNAWLIRKGGYFYRPNCQGYTTSKAEACRYTEAEAKSEASVEPWHMSAILADDVPTPARSSLNLYTAGALSAVRAEARREALALAKSIAQKDYDECEMAVGPCSETGAYECSLERSGRDCLCMHGLDLADKLESRLAALSDTAGQPERWRPTHQHVKRASTYRVIGEAEAQVSTGAINFACYSRQIEDGSRLTVYQGEDGKLWVRFTDEFNDGRFVQLPAEGGRDGT